MITDEYLPNLVSLDKDIKCSICSQSSSKVCSACKQVAYCTEEHQIIHWEKHIKECCPFKVLCNEKLGRYAVAIRDLEPGEVVVREKPVVFGPKHFSPPICLGCLVPIQSSQNLRCCTTCGWPVCSLECEKLPCHAEYECPIFAAAKTRFVWNPACVGGSGESENEVIADNPMLQCITPLRLLLGKEKDPARWAEEVEPMEAHMEKRRNTLNWNSDLVNVSGFLRKACRLAEKYSDDDVLWACGVLQVNAFEARSRQGGSAQCLYPRLAIFSHSCVPNIAHSIDSDYNMVGRVSVAVSRGQLLNTCYAHTLSPTLERRKFLQLTKYFDCDCKRCADPTELGTNSSTLLCKTCGKFYKGEFISTDPLDSEASWKCKECGDERSALSVEMLLDSLESCMPGNKMRDDVFPGTDDTMELEETLRRCSTVLHPTHAMLTCLRLTLCQLYGNTENLKLSDFLPIMLERKVQLCENIMAVADIVEPGLTRLRGTMFHEWFEPQQMLAKIAYKNGEMNEDEFRQATNKAIKFLEEAAAILSLEETDSVEAIMGNHAREKLHELKNSTYDKESVLQENLTENILKQLKEVLNDYKAQLSSQVSQQSEVKQRNLEDLKAFIKLNNEKNPVLDDLSHIKIDDLNQIINKLEKERLNYESTKGSSAELDVFKKLIGNIQQTTSSPLDLDI
ncbi:uncharacterized protein LOC124160706 [Ischnura elegans]|uniref:uncharacterized protein LOC124160706 n=1 Tax=Ischnura elegans TaxID=197161 RepID=UPI001ED874A7|nr:uncharacterized protein LOC124160706 [Ischnura elegans]